MRCCSERAEKASNGQATVEAAFLIPVLLLVMLMAIQPGIILYDRIVMQSAAADGCRMLATLRPEDASSARFVVERHLKAVPDAPLFHQGDWAVDLQGNSQSDLCAVVIQNSVQPVPLIGAAMGAAGALDAGGMYCFEVEVKLEKDSWLAESGSGMDPRSWVDRWEDKV
ncbi:Flp pilus assembly protein TadG [Slackia heliotrinireducens]|uniref:TadE-like protein n=1 Tax=Slackia heliotrinireducens (strain ATCC 29202 / DSM 20476 / NCTC 11029 / RHS 1) TaxID=471855 RepID=C7N7Z1_SLAHD|nr:TadE/TadG family type IV pilus assembly protein [Slackia heliotrinireducens]ACV23026.1 TadE-like protein [Slackia heliotrinireducens DSM 20476]VEH01945.1 Flp pilus assembly protein TadG [Slackia heliotrinireducens]